MMMRTLILFLFIFTLLACDSSKKIIENPPLTISHIQPDTCLTDKQLKTYYKFVKDSMKIESKNEKQRANKEIDSLKIELKKHRSDNTVIKYEIRFDSKKFNDSLGTIKRMYADSLSAIEKMNKQDNKTEQTEIKQDNKTKQTEIKQENKTKRAKYSRWTLVVVAFVFGFLVRFIWQLVKVAYL